MSNIIHLPSFAGFTSQSSTVTSEPEAASWFYGANENEETTSLQRFDAQGNLLGGVQNLSSLDIGEHSIAINKDGNGDPM
jgi:hypothetical protein